MLNTAAIVGRPNVGKSSLFNKLTGARQAIVHDSPGVTRDRLYGEVEWTGKTFTLIDTGGLDYSKDSTDNKGTDDNSSAFVLSHIRKQVTAAINEAEVVIFLCDLKSGVTADDKEIANMLLRANKQVILAVNKCDATGINSTPPELYEFYSLGLGDPYPLSANHGHGTGDLLDEVTKTFPMDIDTDEITDENGNKVLRVAVIGKPNVGKSTLINALLGEERMIVSNVAGTTRDSADALVEVDGASYILTDTAGIRKKNKFKNIKYDGTPGNNQIEIEKYSVIRALTAVDKSDVCVIMLDVNEGFTEQDGKIAGYAHEHGKPSVIAINKWDSFEKQGDTMDKMRKELTKDYAFMSYVPFVFISALKKQRLTDLFKTVTNVYAQCSRRITTGLLNEALAAAVKQTPPPAHLGQRLKVYYATQAQTNPPTFVLFCNSEELFHFSYRRYIENRFREAFELVGTPIKIIVRERDGDKK